MPGDIASQQAFEAPVFVTGQDNEIAGACLLNAPVVCLLRDDSRYICISDY